MGNANHQLADAIREVTAAVQTAIAEGYRSRAIDADDLVEVLLAIADRLDPPVAADVEPRLGCPNCGMVDSDRLIWIDDESVRCDGCGTVYRPAV